MTDTAENWETTPSAVIPPYPPPEVAPEVEEILATVGLERIEP